MTGPDIAVPQPAPRRRRNWGVLVVGLVIGAVAGAGGLTWMFTSGDPAAGPEGDVATACSLVRRTGQLTKDSKVNFAAYGRWSAANALMLEVGEDHPEYKPLAEALSQSAVITAQTQRTDAPEFEAQVQKAHQFCEGR